MASQDNCDADDGKAWYLCRSTSKDLAGEAQGSDGSPRDRITIYYTTFQWPKKSLERHQPLVAGGRQSQKGNREMKETRKKWRSRGTQEAPAGSGMLPEGTMMGHGVALCPLLVQLLEGLREGRKMWRRRQSLCFVLETKEEAFSGNEKS